MYAVRRGTSLPTEVAAELDDLAVTVTAWGNKGHLDDGTNRDGMPIGAMVKWPLLNQPARWIRCDGGAVSRATYKALFKVIGVSQGIGDGSTTFNVPMETDFIIYAGV